MVSMSIIPYVFFSSVVAWARHLAPPPNPVNVTMYNLRPYNLTSDISEKDSADAMGDIFFYITDRLVTPYACRHSSQIHPPFMCEDFQKVLQTHDQVYTKLIVQVDSSFGGCANGSVTCSKYADCNPVVQQNSELQWDCDCDPYYPPPSDRSTWKLSRFKAGDNYWQCSGMITKLCGYSSGSACTDCVSQHRQKELSNCSDEVLAKGCTQNWKGCRNAVDATGCNKQGTSLDDCLQCAQKDPRPEAANCSIDEATWVCQSAPKSCAVTGKLTVDSRYCGTVDSSGLCSICADGCEGVWSRWKSQVSVLGGLWYSTAKEGDCSNPSSSCAWKVLLKEKTVNATCANNNVHAAVEDQGKACFSQCSQPTNTTSDCWILCFVETVLGRDPLNMSRIVGTPMTASQLTGPWLKAFESEDPAQGGCANLPPAPSSIII